MTLELRDSYIQPDTVDVFDRSSAEIIAHHDSTGHLFVINGVTESVDIIDNDDLTLVASIPVDRPLQSLAIHGDTLVVAAANSTNTQAPGAVIFYNLLTYARTKEIAVGSLPDAVFFSPNGKKVVVCNEGEPDDIWDEDNLGTDHNPEGTVTIIHIDDHPVADLDDSHVVHVDFNEFDVIDLREDGIKVTGPGSDVIDTITTLSQYLEPEYAAISKNSKRAYICLQENSAIATIDLDTSEVLSIMGLGVKDMGLQYNAFDASDKSITVDIKPWPNVRGMLQPDGIALLEQHGHQFIVTANEGDAQDYGGYSEEARVGDAEIVLNTVAFPDAVTTKLDENLGRLKITTELGKNVNGEYEELYAYGGRSFSIFELLNNDTELAIIYDSGAHFEQITSVALPTGFNSSNDANGLKKRSDDKGPEPENVVVTKVKGVTIAIIALERVGGLIVYDISDPSAPTFMQYLNNRNFSVSLSDPPTALELAVVKDLGPEGLIIFDNDFLAVANEVSGSTTVYELDKWEPVGVSRQFTLTPGTAGNPEVLSVTLHILDSLSEIPGATVQWVRDDHGLFTILDEETGLALTIPDVDLNDEAEYFALITANNDSIVDCRATERVFVQP